jgi:glycosyltransferase involved in cell wall biosynthesis
MPQTQMHGANPARGGIGCDRETFKMKILYLTNHLNIGGITSYLFSLAQGMQLAGHRVYLACAGGEMEEDFRREGISCIKVPLGTKSEASPKIVLSFFQLLPFIREEKIDIIHSNTRVTQVLGCLLARFSARPYISTCHGFFKKKLSRLIFPCWGRKVIAISEAVKKHLSEDFKVDPGDICVIPNGIDVERFQVKIKKDFGLGAGPVVGIIARLSDVKGHVYLIRAMQEVLTKIPSAKLLIVGDGKMKEELVGLVERLGLIKSVFFVPSLRDTREALSLMDVFVLPSLKEGLGLSLMEAMAAGLAVIGSDVGGIKNLIQNGNNGILAQAQDVGGLSKAILELLQDQNKREYLGNNAREFIRGNFALGKMIAQTQEVYTRCLGAG